MFVSINVGVLEEGVISYMFDAVYVAELCSQLCGRCFDAGEAGKRDPVKKVRGSYRAPLKGLV